jgi:ArsR family transcriptional regulator, arsenate/arsenite/antimonite-responsive transcriptional repressor
VRVTTANDPEQAAWFFHALADETRLRIIDRLVDGEQCVCDLTDALGIAQSRLSFHLKTLKEAGIVTDRREGRWVYYALDRDALAGLERWLGPLAPRPLGLRVRPRKCD